MSAKTMSGKTWLKLLAPVLASIFGLVTLRLLGPDIISQKTLSEWIEPFGTKAPLAFVLFLALRPFTLLPGQLFTAVGGILFGSVMASVYSLLGSFLANALVFFVAKRYGSRLMRRWTKNRYDALKRVAKHHDFRFAVLTTLNPLTPTDITVACAAASGARFWPSMFGNLIGTLPGTFLTASFGSALSQGKTVMTIAAATGMVVSLVAGIFLGRRVVKELRAEPTSDSCPAVAGETHPPIRMGFRRALRSARPGVEPAK